MVSRNAAIIILVVLAIIEPIPVIVGAAFGFLKMKLWQALILIIGLWVLLLAAGLGAASLTSAFSGVGASVISAGVLIAALILVLFTYAGYHFAREIHGVRIDL